MIIVVYGIDSRHVARIIGVGVDKSRLHSIVAGQFEANLVSVLLRSVGRVNPRLKGIAGVWLGCVGYCVAAKSIRGHPYGTARRLVDGQNLAGLCLK